MTPLGLAVVLISVVAVTVALVMALMAVRRLAARGEAVLELAQREIPPLTAQITALSADMRRLTQQASINIEHAGTLLHRAEEVSGKVSTLIGAVSSVTRAGQVVTVAAGLKRGLDVFVSRLRTKHH
jgi:uncharacterized protein YoxC